MERSNKYFGVTHVCVGFFLFISLILELIRYIINYINTLNIEIIPNVLY